MLRRLDRMRALDEVWSADIGNDDAHDAAIALRDALLVTTHRLLRFFVFAGVREPSELSPTQLVPGWTPTTPSAATLRKYLANVSDDVQFVCVERSDPPFALILKCLLDVADEFSWELGARNPEAARDFDHNIAELRRRLGFETDGP